ncbi:MAG TPA: hypothetical protein VGG27_02720 [Magnetospirillaceae bacterium]
MALPKFLSGQTVRVIQNKRVTKASGNFEVGRVLPEEKGVHQYLIRSTSDGHQRVVAEYEIA